MALPDPRPALVQAPARAGVGLRAQMLRQRTNRPPPQWPDDWWQRNCDDLLEPQPPDPVPLCGRQLQIPPAPIPPPTGVPPVKR